VRALVALLAARRDYRLLLSAGLVSLAGDWVLRVGLAFLVYDLTGSTAASGATLLSSYLPQLLLASPAGVLVDRWDRRRTMVATNLLQAAGLLPLVLVTDAHRVWIVYLVALWQGCLAQFFQPAEQATVPHLVPADALLQANAVNSQSRDLARLTGSTTGGVLAAWGGMAAVALFDAATFLTSALLIAGIRFRAPVAAARVRSSLRLATSRLRGEWADGLRLATSEPTMRLLLGFGLITSVGEGIMGTLFAPFVHDVLHGDGTDYGLITGVQSIGGIVGGLLIASFGARWSPRALFGWGSVAFGVVDLVLFLYPLAWPHVAPALLLMVLVGFPGACTIAGFMTVFQTCATDAYRGRLFGAITAVEAVAVLAGIGLASWLGEAIGIVPVIAVQGGGFVVGGLLVLVALRLPERDEGPATATAG